MKKRKGFVSNSSSSSFTCGVDEEFRSIDRPAKTKNNPEPNNNDGRATCFWCGNPTRHIEGFMTAYDVCDECGK